MAHKELTDLHYLVDKGKRGKLKRKAGRLGYDVKSISRGVVHYQNQTTKDHVVSLKGTNPLNAKDLISDFKIAIGATNKDSQFKGRKKEIKKIYKNIPSNQGVDLTSHSLGGSIATSIMAKSKSIRDRTGKAHTYNAGYTRALHSELKKDLTPDDRAQLNDKLVHHRISSDVVSEGLKHGSIGKVKTYKAKPDATLLESHSLSAFD
mgnify:CR=1 FL=1